MTGPSTSDAFRSQRELLAITRTANPTDLASIADRWVQCADIAEQAADFVEQRLEQLTGEGGWTGPAAAAYKARLRTDLITPLRTFAANARLIGTEVGSVALEIGRNVRTALANPIPWDQETAWRVEQRQVDRGWFSYIDEFATGADEAWEEAQSNAPYEIKTGGGAVRKEVPKPEWQRTVATVGSPPVPSVYGRSGVAVSGDVVRFDALMEYQGMNVTQRALLRQSAEQVNAAMSTMLPVGDDGSVGGPPEVNTPSTPGTGGPSPSGPGGGTDGAGPHVGAPAGPGTASAPTGPGSAAPVAATTPTTPHLPGTPPGTGSAGAIGGSPGAMGGLPGGSFGGMGGGVSGMPGAGGGAAFGTATVGMGGLGAAGTGALGAGLRPAGTGAAGMGMMPPMMGGAGGGGTAGGAAASRRPGRTVNPSGFGGAGFPGGGASTGAVGQIGGGFAGAGPSGSNASFSMGTAGRGTVSPGMVGPVGNAQVNPAGVGGSGGAGGGMMGAPMGPRGGRQTDDDESDPEQMYLDEDRSVWDDAVTAPPGHIR